MKCPECQIELPSGSRFCLECGMNLQVASSALGKSPEPTKPHAVPEPERKSLTAFFSDLTAYVAMTERLDPEQVKEVKAPTA
jgi:hypothetical protein